MNHIELLALKDRIQDLGMQLYNIATIQDRLVGLIASCESVFDQQALEMGKSLPNVEARKVYKDKLKSNDFEYVQWSSELALLKLEKMSVALERDGSKVELELEILEIKRSTAQMEKDTLYAAIDQTNYLMTIKQQEEFEN